ncbi:hypothetical protein A8B98_20125 [Hymenobacter sp. UV11]|nr:hypothetical protein A8B98_20125 [Hymenobacter sp. UV11]
MYLLLLALLTTNPASPRGSVVQQPKHSEAVNDAFVNSLLDRVSYARLVAAHYPTPAKAPQAGSGRMVSFSHGVNQFTCFKSPDNTFPASFIITSSEPLLAPVLTLGSTKSAILKRLGVSRSLDILQVSNLEAMALVTLYFQNDKLAKVTYGATID